MKYQRTEEERLQNGYRLVTNLSNGAVADIAHMTVIAIHDRCWEVDGKRSFTEFLEKHGVKPETLLDILKALAKNENDPVIKKQANEAMDLVDLATRNPVGRPSEETGYNVPNKREGRRGNSLRESRRVLREKHPEMLERVEAGEMSYHQAMKMTGHRRSYLQVPADDLQAALGKIETHFKVKVRLA